MLGGELEGRYRVLSKIGEGAKGGEVYLVQHLGLGRKEVLKVLRFTRDTPTLVTRFRRDARATNRLQHPNIVAIHDFGRLPDGRFYIATEYTEGDSLDQVLLRVGPLPVTRALPILIQLAGAIDHAHSRSVVHRDLKPAKLMLVAQRGQADQLKVLDFGLSKILSADDAELALATGQDEIFGTPAYMAPEQVLGKADDPRIDIYAVGCIAFELVVGTPPFVGRPLEVMNNQMWAQPLRPSEMMPQAMIPREYDEIVLRCLEKKPADRFQTGANLRAALAELCTGNAVRAAAYVRDTGRGTDHTSPDDTRLVLQHALLQLAEAIIDLGCSDFQLAISAARIAGTRGHLEMLVTRMEELARARDAVAQRARESEGRFRFAVSQLRFELEQAGNQGAGDPDVTYQLEQLEIRMAELAGHAERELATIDDGAIALAAERATREEELAGQLTTLERQVEEALPRFRGHPLIEGLYARVESLRAQL